MKVKVDHDWLGSNVFSHEFNGKVWREVIEDHDCTGEYLFDVNIKEGKGCRRYGVRIGFFDERLPHHKLYITPTEGYYEIEGATA